jgi:phosphopantothenate-cysteine ligase
MQLYCNYVRFQVVVGNLLETRKKEVIIVTGDDHKWIRLSDDELASDVEIEQFIVDELARRHAEHTSGM